MNVIITGASQGIGKKLAEVFAESGANLFLCSRNISKGMAWQKELMAKHQIEISSFDADLSQKEEVYKFADAISRAWDKVDILINNAGIFTPGNIFDEPDNNLEHMINLNLYSAYHLTRAILPGMMAQKHGHIFNMCSVASLKAYPQGGAYSISKYALDGFSKNLREEMKGHQIKVTSVYPGATFTPSWDGFQKEERLMESADVAKMILAASKLSHKACVEEIVLRPQLGDV
ncbi:MAG: SDR family NAD(P)-dependent oxidoreductase [Chitinophagaceae bacterium]